LWGHSIEEEKPTDFVTLNDPSLTTDFAFNSWYTKDIDQYNEKEVSSKSSDEEPIKPIN
jgi:hypothetical protein